MNVSCIALASIAASIAYFVVGGLVFGLPWMKDEFGKISERLSIPGRGQEHHADRDGIHVLGHRGSSGALRDAI